LRTQLKLALRTGRTRRISPSRTAETRGKIQNMVTISERPPEVADRAVPGHWEGDLERHEALCNRVEVKDLHRCAVAAA
jgi:transposase, IS30 family